MVFHPTACPFDMVTNPVMDVLDLSAQVRNIVNFDHLKYSFSTKLARLSPVLLRIEVQYGMSNKCSS